MLDGDSSDLVERAEVSTKNHALLVGFFRALFPTRPTHPSELLSMDQIGVFQNDPALLTAYREGQPEALERVYRAYVGWIGRYLRNQAHASSARDLAQVSVVADLLQEVFTRAFSSHARLSYDETRDYGGYLTTIARNCFIDLLRDRHRQVPTELDDLSAAMGHDARPQDPYDPHVLAIVRSHLAELRMALRSIYEQRYVHGLSQEQACATLGLSRRSLRTAERKLHLGIRKTLSRAGISLADLCAARSDSRELRRQ